MAIQNIYTFVTLGTGIDNNVPLFMLLGLGVGVGTAAVIDGGSPRNMLQPAGRRVVAGTSRVAPINEVH